MRKNLLFCFLIIVGISGMKFQCNRDENDIKVKYAFKEKMTIAPYQLNYSVGDTVWIDTRMVNKMLFDTLSNSKIAYDNAKFTSSVSVELLYNNPYVGNGPFAKFIYFPGTSGYTTHYPYTSRADVTFGCTPSFDYELKLGIVLLEKGVFGIGTSNHVRKCDNSLSDYVSITFAFDITDTHKQYYQQLPFSSIGKQQDVYTMRRLDEKTMVVVNVQ